MKTVSAVVKQLQKERSKIEKQLEGINAALSAFVGVYKGTSTGKRTISAEGRKRIAAAQRARWKKVRAAKKKKAA